MLLLTKSQGDKMREKLSAKKTGEASKHGSLNLKILSKDWFHNAVWELINSMMCPVGSNPFIEPVCVEHLLR